MSAKGTAKGIERRPLHWERVRGPKSIFAVLVATALGAGLLPLAPGTWGTIIALPIAYFTAGWDWLARFILWFGLAVLGTWSAKVFDETMQSSDNQNIVIDEVVGLGITAWTAGTNWTTLLVAFVLFRFFDVVKPPPIRQVDRWSKKKAANSHSTTANSNGPGQEQVSRYWGGFGVMADDILAGFEGLIVILVLQALGTLPH